MSDEAINEFFYTLQKHYASHTTQRESTWENFAPMQAQASVSQQAYNFEGVNYFNNNEGYFSQPQNITPSYNYSGWGTYDNFSYGNPMMKCQESSSSNYQEQIKQLSEEKLFHALKEEIMKDKEALEM